MSQQFTSQILSHQPLSPGTPEVSRTVLSWLGAILQWDLGKADAGSLEGRSCSAMGLLSAQKGGVCLCLPVSLFAPRGDFSPPLTPQGL